MLLILIIMFGPPIALAVFALALRRILGTSRWNWLFIVSLPLPGMMLVTDAIWMFNSGEYPYTLRDGIVTACLTETGLVVTTVAVVAAIVYVVAVCIDAGIAWKGRSPDRQKTARDRLRHSFSIGNAVATAVFGVLLLGFYDYCQTYVPLYLAIELNDSDLVAKRLRFDLYGLNSVEHDVLSEALSAKNYEFAEQLIVSGADPKKSPTGDNRLTFFVYENDIEEMNFLLAHGADPSASYSGRTPLEVVISHIISFQRDIRRPLRSDEETLAPADLERFVENAKKNRLGYMNTLEALLNAGADATKDSGFRGLAAHASLDRDLVMRLIRAGADPNRREVRLGLFS